MWGGKREDSGVLKRWRLHLLPPQVDAWAAPGLVFVPGWLCPSSRLGWSHRHQSHSKLMWPLRERGGHRGWEGALISRSPEKEEGTCSLVAGVVLGPVTSRSSVIKVAAATSPVEMPNLEALWARRGLGVISPRWVGQLSGVGLLHVPGIACCVWARQHALGLGCVGGRVVPAAKPTHPGGGGRQAKPPPPPPSLLRVAPGRGNRGGMAPSGIWRPWKSQVGPLPPPQWPGDISGSLFTHFKCLQFPPPFFFFFWRTFLCVMVQGGRTCHPSYLR